MTLDLDAIEARHKSENWQCCKDVAALVAEVRALRAVAEAALESREAERDTHYAKDDLARTIAALDRAREAERNLDAALDAWRAGGGE